MKRLQSLRWRLPLNYAGIALLANLALGLLLLFALRAHYREREHSYLIVNAMAVSERLAPLVAEGASRELLAAHLRGYAFLLQTRILLHDADFRLLADSGSPDQLELELEAAAPQPGAAEAGYETRLRLSRAAASSAPLPSAERQPAPSGGALPPLPPPPLVPFAGTLYGFNLGPEAAQTQRSERIIAVPIFKPGTYERPIGSIELREGPAYGRQIVALVAALWIGASVLATLLAALAGWRVSRRTTAPLLALTDATQRMADGDLSARAASERADELGLLAQSFNRMAGRIEQVVATLRRFVADAAHELHTPLTALQTNLELALESADQAEQTRFVRLARADAERLERLANDLLDLSQMESAPKPGTAPSYASTVDLNQLLLELRDVYGSRAEQQGLALSFRLPAAPVSIPGHERQLRRALSNLLDNALKFTPAAGTVAVELSSADHGVELSICDSGIGIPEDELPLIFNRFHRGRNVASYPGSGLGLAIVRAIVTAHAGAISVASSARGTCFTLRWPAGAIS